MDFNYVDPLFHPISILIEWLPVLLWTVVIMHLLGLFIHRFERVGRIPRDFEDLFLFVYCVRFDLNPMLGLLGGSSISGFVLWLIFLFGYTMTRDYNGILVCLIGLDIMMLVTDYVGEPIRREHRRVRAERQT